jgi:PAS domain S-box-containing protein
MHNELGRFVNALPGFVWTALPDGHVVFVNQRWCEYTGLSLQQASGSGWQSAVHPEDLADLLERWLAMLASGAPGELEVRLRRFDGAYRWFLIACNPLRDEAGKIVQWCGLNTDIDERKRAEKTVKSGEHDLSSFINTMPTTAWSTRPDGYCDFLNKRWLDYAGMSEEEALGWGWIAAIHPDDVGPMSELWQSALATGTPADTEARMRRFDGVYRWFLFRDNPARDESGNVLRWYGTAIDIEDRKRAEEELRRSEVLLAEGQRVSQTGSFYWRADSEEIRSSAELYRILGFEQGSPVTLERVTGRVLPEDVPLLNEKIAQARAGELDLDYEIRLRMPDDSLKYVRMTAYGTRDRDGRLEFVGTLQELTERRLSEEALANVRSELAYMTRVASMGALTASIAHEVNQPLSGIITNANTCLRMLAADPPNVDGALETARRTIRDGNRATAVITRLRALFARKKAASELVDLNEATREVIALSVKELQRNRVTLRTELANDLPPVTGDRIQLQQVVLNLLMNASASMIGVEDRPRELVIRTEQEASECVRLTVQDAGVGIRPDDSEKLFEAFYTTKSSGMGIGLSVSRSIIENHEGRLWAKPNEGPGATFAFSIPADSRA